VWRQARDDAKLPAWVHWHALRDFYASSLIRSGLDLRTVMTLMGHTSSEETLRVYARLWPDAQDRARQALEGLWSEKGTGQDQHQGSTTSL
jgi:site-specific recombinase XerD